MANVYHHGIFRRKGRFLPDSLINLLCRKDTASVFHEQLHNLGLCSRQLHRLSVRIKCALLQSIAESAVYNLILLMLGMNPAQHGIPAKLAFHPGCQLLGMKGFGHIIIRTHGQSQNLIRILCLGA